MEGHGILDSSSFILEAALEVQWQTHLASPRLELTCLTSYWLHTFMLVSSLLKQFSFCAISRDRYVRSAIKPSHHRSAQLNITLSGVTISICFGSLMTAWIPGQRMLMGNMERSLSTSPCMIRAQNGAIQKTSSLTLPSRMCSSTRLVIDALLR